MDLMLVVFPIIMLMCAALLLFFLLKIGSLKKELQISRKCFIMSYPREYVLLGIILFAVSIALVSMASIHAIASGWSVWNSAFAILTGLFGFCSIVIFAVLSTFKIVVSKDMMVVYHVFKKREDVVFSDIIRVEREYGRIFEKQDRQGKPDKPDKPDKPNKMGRSKLLIYHSDSKYKVLSVDEGMIGCSVFVKMLEKNGISISNQKV